MVSSVLKAGSLNRALWNSSISFASSGAGFSHAHHARSSTTGTRHNRSGRKATSLTGRLVACMGSIGVLEHLIEAAGGLQIAVTTFWGLNSRPRLIASHSSRDKGNMHCISESFVHPAGLTDLDIHIAAKGVLPSDAGANGAPHRRHLGGSAASPSA